ncbi:MAG TPA: TetR family transcriptional regulator [Micromonosporaceae bacterium]|jgi:AcrR family transcriptional regulator
MVERNRQPESRPDVPEQPARPALSREAILDEALRLADERGLGAASMRALADRVGVTPMALYPYVGSKAAMLDGLVDRMLAEFLPDASAIADAPWQERLRRIGLGARELAHRHPTTFTLLFERPAVTPDAVRVVDAIYQALLDAGIPDAQVPRLERLFTTFCLGFALSDVNGRFAAGEVNPRARRADAAPGSVPAHERLAAVLDDELDLAAEYHADLENLIELVAAVASSDKRLP